MVKKQLFYSFYIFFVCGEKNILPRSRVFLAPWSRSRSKKNTRSRSRFGKKSGAGAGARAAWKKSGAGATKKFAGSPALMMSILNCRKMETIYRIQFIFHGSSWQKGLKHRNLMKVNKRTYYEVTLGCHLLRLITFLIFFSFHVFATLQFGMSFLF